MAKKAAVKKKTKPKKVPNPFKNLAKRPKTVRAPLVRTARLDMRTTPEEKAKLLAAAKKANMSLTAFVMSRA